MSSAILPGISSLRNPPGVAARLLMGAAAGAAAIWLALSFGSERLELQATQVDQTDGKISATKIDDALRMVRKARALQPDAGPELVEARLLNRRGRTGQTQALLHEIVRSEPANAEAWVYLIYAARDPREAREARRRFEALRPR